MFPLEQNAGDDEQKETAEKQTCCCNGRGKGYWGWNRNYYLKCEECEYYSQFVAVQRDHVLLDMELA